MADIHSLSNYGSQRVVESLGRNATAPPPTLVRSASPTLYLTAVNGNGAKLSGGASRGTWRG